MREHDVEAALGEGKRRLARVAADLEHPRPGREADEGHEIVEELRRVVRARPVVQLGHLLERRPPPAAQLLHRRRSLVHATGPRQRER